MQASADAVRDVSAGWREGSMPSVTSIETKYSTSTIKLEIDSTQIQQKDLFIQPQKSQPRKVKEHRHVTEYFTRSTRKAGYKLSEVST